MGNRSIRTPFSGTLIEELARVLGDHLNGTQIGTVLSDATIKDVLGAGQTKWRRICYSLIERQNKDKSGNCVIRFITEAMNPVRYRDTPAEMRKLQSELNEILIYEGLRVTDEGKVARKKGGAARTLDEATQRAGTIYKELQRRNVHPEVLKYCNTELFQKNNFHALLEASKSIPDRLRTMTGLKGDGATLVRETILSRENKLVFINTDEDETDRSEQKGFGNLIIGLLGMYRNTTAHPAKINREVTDEELLEAFATFSMVHRRLDDAKNKRLSKRGRR